ncbi:MAG: efflux RND transporter periplasmic adaptor subunit [Chlorobiales bacterium]
MKTLKWILIVGAIFGVAITILLNNKARSDEKARLSQAVEKAVTVVVAQVTKGDLEQDLTLVGTITANNDVAIVSEIDGRVTGVAAEVGDYKQAGALLVQVDDELKLASFKSAEVAYEKAKKDYERYQSLIKDGAISDSQLEQARQAYQAAEAQFIVARRQYEDTKIKTPISGVVTERKVNVGSYLSKGALVGNVVDISRLKVKVNVAEQDVFKLKTGDEVEVRTDVYPGVVFKGKIQTIGAKGDEAHTYPVEITIPNSKENPLKAGMFGRISFTTIGKRETLLIPREALVGSVKNPKVFVAEAETARLRDIVVGREAGMMLEVLDGLKEGEFVVTNGQNNLKDGYRIALNP